MADERRVKGRGVVETIDQESSRYKGRGGIFDRLSSESGPGPIQSVEGWSIFVRGVHEEASEDDITDAFSEFGEVKSVNLPLDRRTGYVKGYALVEYGKRQEAEKAIKDMNGKQLMGNTLEVNWAFFLPSKSQ